MEIINNLPRELQFVIFGFTDEFARRYARKLKFKKFGDKDNTVFPKHYFRLAKSISNPKQADTLWRIEKRLRSIIKEKRDYIETGIKRPCLQHSINKNHDFKEHIFPESHNIKYSLWAVNNYHKLISYSLKVTLDGYYTILVVKKSDLENFKKLVNERTSNHKMRKYIDEYIFYCDSSMKKMSNIPKIFCVPYEFGLIHNIKGFIDLLHSNNMKSYLLTPYTNNPKINNLVNSLTNLTNGSGKYELG